MKRAGEENDAGVTGGSLSWPENDRFSGRAQHSITRTSVNTSVKAQVNEALASCAAGLDPPVSAFVLDGAEGSTSRALIGAGLLPSNIMSPNLVPAVVESLAELGVKAWLGKAEEYISAPAPSPSALVYLDHTGALPSRLWQIRSVLDNLRPEVFACTFSTRHGSIRATEKADLEPIEPASWSAAECVKLLLTEVLKCRPHASGVGGRWLSSYHHGPEAAAEFRRLVQSALERSELSPPHPSSPLAAALAFFAGPPGVVVESFLTTPTPNGARPFAVHAVTLEGGGHVKDKWVKDLREYAGYEMKDECGLRECVCLYPEQMCVGLFRV